MSYEWVSLPRDYRYQIERVVEEYAANNELQSSLWPQDGNCCYVSSNPVNDRTNNLQIGARDSEEGVVIGIVAYSGKPSAWQFHGSRITHLDSKAERFRRDLSSAVQLAWDDSFKE